MIVSYFNDNDANARGECFGFTRGIKYDTIDLNYPSQDLLAVDISSLNGNNFSAGDRYNIDKNKIQNEFSDMLATNKPITKSQNEAISKVFKTCIDDRFIALESGTELNLSSAPNTRAFITLRQKELPNEFNVVVYTMKGKYLIAMSTAFSENNYYLTNRAIECGYEPGNPSKQMKPNCYSDKPNLEDIKLANEAANRLLKTFKLK